MNFLLSPRARSSSMGVLGTDRGKGKSDEDGDFNDAPNSLRGKGAGSRPDTTEMARLQPPAARRTAILQPRPLTRSPIFAKIISQWSSIIQKGTSRTIPLVMPKRILVSYITPMASLLGISIGGIYILATGSMGE
ncbi:hypothetical protein B9Z19DRAFT_1136697 [Tuber borchii]|uniref:Uncharacterized protein n=1 Tax=Tuber borchii TaxID=42251 RepID=A0A2T6ZBD6_TUBBO|nr:hypothetical protein B9Z19DRAFT_1136697 [Tuber borchii]